MPDNRGSLWTSGTVQIFTTKGLVGRARLLAPSLTADSETVVVSLSRLAERPEAGVRELLDTCYCEVEYAAPDQAKKALA